jgi:hypothetical protein
MESSARDQWCCMRKLASTVDTVDVKLVGLTNLCECGEGEVRL